MKAVNAQRELRALYDEEMSAAKAHARDMYSEGKEPEQVVEALRSYEQYLLGIMHSASAIGIRLDRVPLSKALVKSWFNKWETYPELADLRSALLNT